MGYGVRQRSLLASLLFILFVNDINYLSEACYMFCMLCVLLCFREHLRNADVSGLGFRIICAEIGVLFSSNSVRALQNRQ